MTIRFILLLGAVSIYGCGSRHNATVTELQQGKDADIQYAQGFNIRHISKLTIINVFNPWEGAKGIEFKYLLCPRGEKIPDSLKKIPVIYTPVKRIICLSTTHIAQLSFIGKVNTLVGVANPGFIGDSIARKMIDDGKILNVGYDQALNYETIVSLKPDLVMAYGVQAETMNQYRKLEDFGIKVILNGEYLETSPLGKLEWVKFMAALYNISEQTSEKFNKVVTAYQQLTKICINAKNKPKILCGIPWKGVWYVPGGESYLARMIADAGGDYIWKGIPQRESIPMNFEKVIEHANEADIWINAGIVNSLNDILAEDERLTVIRSFKEKQVYNNNARSNARGGNEFWESGLIEPEVILKDLIKIFHPELFPGYTLVYYKKLK
jgi:iron complex transport system substrate-binding protein